MFKKTWQEKFQLATEIYNEKGYLMAGVNDMYKDYPIGRWLVELRTLKKNGKLSQKKITQLEEIGMVWNQSEFAWQRNYLLAKEYYEVFGNLRIPQYYVKEGIKLGIWLQTQRRKAEYPEKYNALSQEQITMLNEIGMVWKPYKAFHEKQYKILKQYYKDHGNLIIKYNDEKEADAYKALQYVKTLNKNNRLTDYEIKVFSQIGLEW